MDEVLQGHSRLTVLDIDRGYLSGPLLWESAERGLTFRIPTKHDMAIYQSPPQRTAKAAEIHVHCVIASHALAQGYPLWRERQERISRKGGKQLSAASSATWRWRTGSARWSSSETSTVSSRTATDAPAWQARQAAQHRCG